MTVSASSTAELTIGEIVLNAYRLASMWSLDQAPSGLQWNNRAVAAMKFLETIVKGVETEGRLVRARRFYTFTLTSGTTAYDMPASIMDVYGDAVYIPAGESLTASPTENLIQQVSMEQYQLLGPRDVSGVPTFYMTERSSSAVRLTFWQIPNEAGSVRVEAYYLLANSTDAAATPDLERHWAGYLQLALAAKLAEAGDQGRDKIRDLRGEAAVALEKAKGYSRERTGFRLVMRHRGPWRN